MDDEADAVDLMLLSNQLETSLRTDVVLFSLDRGTFCFAGQLSTEQGIGTKYLETGGLIDAADGSWSHVV